MFPKYRDIEYPLLRELARRGGSSAPRGFDERGRSVYTALADEFGLTDDERDARTIGDGESRVHWEKMVRWARQKLLDRGLLTSSKHGVWKVSPEGFEYLQADGEADYERHPEPALLPEEVPETSCYVEGAVRRISVNAYERSPEARQQCISTHQARCCICGFDFGAAYGSEFTGFIHVHHLRPLSEVRAEYEVDAVEDLRPVCPNCHAIIHHGGHLRSIEEVRRLLTHQGHASP